MGPKMVAAAPKQTAKATKAAEAAAAKAAAAYETRTQQTMFAQICGSADASPDQKAAFDEYKCCYQTLLYLPLSFCCL